MTAASTRNQIARAALAQVVIVDRTTPAEPGAVTKSYAIADAVIAALGASSFTRDNMAAAAVLALADFKRSGNTWDDAAIATAATSIADLMVASSSGPDVPPGAPTGTPNAIAQFDGAGDLEASPAWSVDPVTSALSFELASPGGIVGAPSNAIEVTGGPSVAPSGAGGPAFVLGGDGAMGNGGADSGAGGSVLLGGGTGGQAADPHTGGLGGSAQLLGGQGGFGSAAGAAGGGGSVIIRAGAAGPDGGGGGSTGGSALLDAGAGSGALPAGDLNLGTSNAAHVTIGKAGVPVTAPGFLLLGGSGQSLDLGAAPPVAGLWQRGSIRFNSAPAIGSPKAWQCTATGTPGTWVSTGNL